MSQMVVLTWSTLVSGLLIGMAVNIYTAQSTVTVSDGHRPGHPPKWNGPSPSPVPGSHRQQHHHGNMGSTQQQRKTQQAEREHHNQQRNVQQEHQQPPHQTVMQHHQEPEKQANTLLGEDEREDVHDTQEENHHQNETESNLQDNEQTPQQDTLEPRYLQCSPQPAWPPSPDTCDAFDPHRSTIDALHEEANILQKQVEELETQLEEVKSHKRVADNMVREEEAKNYRIRIDREKQHKEKKQLKLDRKLAQEKRERLARHRDSLIPPLWRPDVDGWSVGPDSHGQADPTPDLQDILDTNITSANADKQPVMWVDDTHGAFKEVLVVVFTILERLNIKAVTGNYVQKFDSLYTRYHLFAMEQRQTYKRFLPKHMINHFPYIASLTYKPNIASLWTRMNFIPRSYVLPKDARQLRSYARFNPGKKWLQKDVHHRGIKLNTSEEITQINLNAGDRFVQEFLEDLMLVDRRRYDLGIFLTVTSIDPLRAYVYNDWLIRFCQRDYIEPFDPRTKAAYVIEGGMVSTPLWRMDSLKKMYDPFDFKRKEILLELFRKRGFDSNKFEADLNLSIVKTLLERVPYMVQKSKQAGRVLGNLYEMMRLDFMLGENLEIYLIEANMSPDIGISKGTLPAQKAVYEELISSMFSLVGVDNPIKAAQHSWTAEQRKFMVDYNDYMVYDEQCYSDICQQPHSCQSHVCRLCDRCLSVADIQVIEKAYLEHVYRERWIRIVPVPFKTPEEAQNWQPATDPFYNRMSQKRKKY